MGVRVLSRSLLGLTGMTTARFHGMRHQKSPRIAFSEPTTMAMEQSAGPSWKPSSLRSVKAEDLDRKAPARPPIVVLVTPVRRDEVRKAATETDWTETVTDAMLVRRVVHAEPGRRLAIGIRKADVLKLGMGGGMQNAVRMETVGRRGVEDRSRAVERRRGVDRHIEARSLVRRTVAMGASDATDSKVVRTQVKLAAMVDPAFHIEASTGLRRLLAEVRPVVRHRS